ncbi:hypothetical protein MTR67_034317, partial [Solanum verrucosum]
RNLSVKTNNKPRHFKRGKLRFSRASKGIDSRYHVGTEILTVGSDTTPDINTNFGWLGYHVSTLTFCVWVP